MVQMGSPRDGKRNGSVSGWGRAQLKHVTRLCYGDAVPAENATAEEREYHVFGSNGPYGACAVANTGAPAIIVGRKGSYGKVTWVSRHCFASDTTLFVDASVCKHDLRWVYWLLQTLALDEGSDETAIPGLNREAVYAITVSIPPRSMQRAIADYLDRETGRLDALATEKKRLLELLAEKRRALIGHAVTRGIRPHVPLRESGVEWLGEIPKHWDTKRARWLFRERDDRSETGSEKLLTVSHLTGVTPRSEKEVNMFEAQSTKGYKICLRGDLVINTLWAWMGAMGVAAEDGIVSPAYNVYEPVDQIDPAYIDALVRLRVFAQEATRHSKGVWSSRLRLYPDEFFAIALPVLPLSEQREIVAFFENEGKKLDCLIEAASEAITLIEERRAVMIESAITGTIDVDDAK